MSPCRADSDATAACRSGARSIDAAASCRPIGQPSVASCRRTQSSSVSRVEALLEDGDRLFELEPQVFRLDAGKIAVGRELPRRHCQRRARSDDDVQVGRGVVEEVGQRFAHRRLRQPLGVVEHQHRRRGEARDLRQQAGERIELAVRLLRILQRHGVEGRAPAGNPHRVKQRPGEARRIVLRVERDPGDQGPLFEPQAPPLHQQRRLAEPARSNHGNGRPVAYVRPHAGKTVSRQRRPVRARRRGLED